MLVRIEGRRKVLCSAFCFSYQLIFVKLCVCLGGGDDALLRTTSQLLLRNILRKCFCLVRQLNSLMYSDLVSSSDFQQCHSFVSACTYIRMYVCAYNVLCVLSICLYYSSVFYLSIQPWWLWTSTGLLALPITSLL